MKKFVIGLFVLGLTSPLLAQVPKVEQLSEVVVTAVNYKYLNAIDSEEVAVPVKMLERKAAAYNVEDSDFYQDDFDIYYISFYIPEGRIVAAYNTEGEIIRTIERFQDVKLPSTVRDAVVERFPNWAIVNDVYRVTYNQNKGAMKTYKIKLKNGDKVMRVKVDDSGEFL
ncbi:nicotinate-nucleotide adenylyltransferase [Maribacter sp. TH_r10]|uniref:Nicotinate-nucleotide adenylyltransferase n=1 Tax=Maribacter luteus TaxID=2594478 RepID=A0A6I2MNT2_9FLAO|nr:MULTISPECIES: nicotinate-nucleotide adenylyltransferase [Maribacter]MDV7137448.1 nicotinate-nucleotide adenylyltransferase [Maribacter sp. TH_r10]MRX64170.1 nicotinate-nucleotide adenylyltransferase [Maribacter luteus]|tara:strand:- start:641 stop:1147 length:507 start_codon:yes stop_codon:yes gene_type:complete